MADYTNEGAHSFDNPFAQGGSAEERVYSALLQTRSPISATALAERAECDPKTATKYLKWFAKLGIATEHDGDPVTYERNDQYFEWRRVNDLASTYSPSELQSRVQELLDRIQTYEDRYGVKRPADVDALSPPDGVSTETAFTEVTDWETARTELRRHERARRLQADKTDRPA